MAISVGLNGGQVAIQITDDTAVIFAQSVPRLVTGTVAAVAYTDHKYNVGDTVAFLATVASFFQDVNDGLSYGIIEEKFVYFSYSAPT